MLCLESILSNLLTIFGVIIVVVLGHYVYLLSNRDYWKNRGVFSPNPTALTGDLPGQINGKRHLMYELDDLYKKYKNRHSYIGIFRFRNPRFLVLDPEVAKEILIKHFKNFQATELYGKIDVNSDPLFGNHMFFQVGEEWKKTRQSISPAFSNNRVSSENHV